MTPGHKLFLGFAVVLIAAMFLIASRPPNQAEIDYRPPNPSAETASAPAGD